MQRIRNEVKHFRVPVSHKQHAHTLWKHFDATWDQPLEVFHVFCLISCHDIGLLCCSLCVCARVCSILRDGMSPSYYTEAQEQWSTSWTVEPIGGPMLFVNISRDSCFWKQPGGGCFSATRSRGVGHSPPGYFTRWNQSILLDCVGGGLCRVCHRSLIASSVSMQGLL